MNRERTLIVGLDEPEYSEIQDRIDGMSVAYEYLPEIFLRDGELYVESRTHTGRFLKVDRVIYHGIYEDDFDFLTALALWRGPCLPDAMGMVDMRLRHSGLARAIRVSRFGQMPRGFSIGDRSFSSDAEIVAKWGNWHCGENKHLFSGGFTPPETAVYEPFIEGEAVRIALVGEAAWQIRLAGDGWLKSIHDDRAGEMEMDPELLEDTRNIARAFQLATVGVDYMVAHTGERHLLEVNHIPNVTVFPFMRKAFIELAADWCAGETPARI
ncbi:MAG: hypothetical protein NXI24_10775 [bacterium]|nr:hypothetical protein [bacterium]